MTGWAAVGSGDGCRGRIWRLAELVEGLAGARILRGGEVPVRGLAYDSRRVRPGDLFVCVPGLRLDGHVFAGEAVQRGAAALLVERAEAVPRDVPAAAVPRVREAMGPLAARFYGHPSRELGLAGVTGTNGKTTTSFLLRSVLESLGPVGLVGTVRNVVGGREEEVVHTTPEAVDLQCLLRRMAAAGDRWAVLEVSSHALALGRVEGCEFDVAVFTNLTRDHLDFHGTMEAYREAKGRLFASLGRERGRRKGPPLGAVLNNDDSAWEFMAEAVWAPVVTYGLEAGQVRATDLDLSPAGSAFRVRWEAWPEGSAGLAPGEVAVRLRLPGRHNVYNALAAFAAGLVAGVSPDAAAAALGRVAGVPGRLERVPGRQPFAVLVDYAHTPDGLENVLRAVRGFTQGRVLVVFGCGGDRDRTKRPLMGEVAARLADVVFVTSDNPRSEEPAAIAEEVLAGVPAGAPAGRPRLVLDREEAIRAALAEAGPGDTVLIAGKGHEAVQIFRDRTVPFRDAAVAARALREMGYGET